jgi:hypothetical protein
MLRYYLVVHVYAFMIATTIIIVTQIIKTISAMLAPNVN